jgi:spermidine synthase
MPHDSDPGALSADGKTFIEWAREGVAGTVFGIDHVIVHRRTPHQGLLLFENAFWGKVLVLDGAVQLTERDEFFYHESLAHPALLARDESERVLIIGGGDGALAEEVLKHPVREVTMVEIDAEVVETARAHLASIHRGVFDDARLRLVIADAATWIQQRHEKYDVILMDITDPGGPSEGLYARETLGAIAGRLAEGGVIALQFGRYFDASARMSALEGDLRRLPWSAVCAAPAPTYPGGVWRFFIGAHKEPRWNPEKMRARLAALPDLRWLSPDFHPPPL